MNSLECSGLAAAFTDESFAIAVTVELDFAAAK
jgi:hypothetical protein